MYKDFEVRAQAGLSLDKCAGIVISGIRFRLFRALVTVMIAALAVAFLMTTLGYSLIGREVTDAIHRLTAPRRMFLFWLNRLSAPMTESELRTALVTAAQGDARWQELRIWGGCDDAALDSLKDVARRESEYLRFISQLSEGQLRPMTGRVRGTQIFELLQDEKAFSRFEEELGTTGLRMPTSFEAFKTFLKDWEQSRAMAERIMTGHRAAVVKFKQVLAGRSPAAALSEPDEDLAKKLQELGFRMTQDESGVAQAEARASLDSQRLERLLQNATFKQRFAIRFRLKNVNAVTPGIFFSEMQSKSGAAWALAALSDIGAPLDMSADRVREIAGSQIYHNKLARVESAVFAQGSGSGLFGFSDRVLWLIAVSLLVCVVGIANGMLMSVSERFKEIATMKCLGATDGFIMRSFIMESSMQGLVGGMIGAVMGFILGGLLRPLFTYGWMGVQNMPMLDMLIVGSVAIGVGVVISVLAAIYPAWVASRLAPMEAMAVE